MKKLVFKGKRFIRPFNGTKWEALVESFPKSEVREHYETLDFRNERMVGFSPIYYLVERNKVLDLIFNITSFFRRWKENFQTKETRDIIEGFKSWEKMTWEKQWEEIPCEVLPHKDGEKLLHGDDKLYITRL